MDINTVVLVGRLTQDPELRHTNSGTAYCRFSLALNRYYKGGDGERKEEVSFFNCVAWTYTAENLVKYAGKGKQIGVSGRLRQNRWEDQSGQKRSTVEVVVENMQLLASPGERSSGQGQSGYDNEYQDESMQSDPYGGSGMNAQGPDDDIPF